MSRLQQPEPFWELRVHEVRESDGVSGLCVGYENGEWRYEAFADYVMDWLPEFCLNSKERTDLNHATARRSFKKAAGLIYQTEKYGKRGEFGEIFLHAAIRSVFDSLPAISKFYYKSAQNDTVKGFDCVHIVGPVENLEIWLGEVKFYSDVKPAIRDAVKSLRDHLTPEFLRNEFILIGNKLDDADNYARAVQKLISERRSLDQIFARVCIPVMLTYDSMAVRDHRIASREYVKVFEAEVLAHSKEFAEKVAGVPLTRYHLFLLPLHEKERLVKVLHDKLMASQKI